jgi:hypothetical protein
VLTPNQHEADGGRRALAIRQKCHAGAFNILLRQIMPTVLALLADNSGFHPSIVVHNPAPYSSVV